MTTTPPISMPAGVRGHLTICALYSDGRRRVLSDRKNQIVFGFLSSVARLITQAPADAAALSQLAVHALWVESSETAFLTGVTPSDQGPAGAVAKQYVFDRDSDVDVNVDGTAGLVEFRAVVDKSECNGLILRAAGLYTRGDNDDPSLTTNPTLVARQLFGAIEKQPEFALEFSWRIQLSILTDSEASNAGDD